MCCFIRDFVRDVMEKPQNKRRKISDLSVGQQIKLKRAESTEFARTIHRRLQRRTGKKFNRGIVWNIAYKKVFKKWGITQTKRLSVLDQIDTVEKWNHFHTVILPRVDQLLKEKYHYR